MFVGLAAASGSWISGAIVMAVFWLGTVPILASVAGLTQFASVKLSRIAPRVTAVLLLLAGFMALFGHVGVPLGEGGHQHHKHHQHMHSS